MMPRATHLQGVAAADGETRCRGGSAVGGGGGLWRVPSAGPAMSASLAGLAGWVRRGRVPVDWAERVSDATGVPAWQLAPDVYWPEPYVSN